jgi:hypothetical protein
MQLTMCIAIQMAHANMSTTTYKMMSWGIVNSQVKDRESQTPKRNALLMLLKLGLLHIDIFLYSSKRA